MFTQPVLRPVATPQQPAVWPTLSYAGAPVLLSPLRLIDDENRSAVLPAGPCGPVGPVAPAGPAGPWAPSLPFVPSTPFVPSVPSVPSTPSLPAAPSLPSAPFGPCRSRPVLAQLPAVFGP